MVASFPTLMGCHRDKICWELIFSFSPHDQAEVIPCRSQLSFAVFRVVWDPSGHMYHFVSPQRYLARNVCRIVWYTGLRCWFENGKDKGKNRLRVEDRKKGPGDEVKVVIQSVSLRFCMLSYMQLTLEINYDPNRHPQLELDATDRNCSFPRSAQTRA